MAEHHYTRISMSIRLRGSGRPAGAKEGRSLCYGFVKAQHGTVGIAGTISIYQNIDGYMNV